MTVACTTRILFVLTAGLFTHMAHAGSFLNVILTVTYGSGPCGAAVTRESVNVFCGPSPVLAPVASGAGLPTQPVTTSLFASSAQPPTGLAGTGSATDGAPFVPFLPSNNDPRDNLSNGPPLPVEEATFRQVGMLPASATGRGPWVVYSGGANVSSWRMVSSDNAEHIELTISW